MGFLKFDSMSSCCQLTVLRIRRKESGGGNKSECGCSGVGMNAIDSTCFNMYSKIYHSVELRRINLW